MVEYVRMAKGSGKLDKVPMLLSYDDHSGEQNANLSDMELQIVASESTVANGLPADGDDHREAGRGPGKHEYLLRSGPLGMCNDPYCTTCPYTNVGVKAELHRDMSKRAQGDETTTWFCCFRRRKIGILNPHSKIVQTWSKIFVVSRLLGIFLDPLFFFLLSVDQRYDCIVLDYNAASALTALRSLLDFIYAIHIILEFRVAYKDESGELVDDPKLCRARYLRGWFVIDVLACLPLPQIMVMLVIPNLVNESTTVAGSFKDMFRLVILIQNIPRFVRFFLLIAGRSPTGFVFETAWANFTLNLFLYVLVGHVVGSCWYLFSVQRVDDCLQDACYLEGPTLGCRKDFLDCGTGTEPADFSEQRKLWINLTSATNTCLASGEATFEYGIYQPMGYLVAQRNSLTEKYIYSLYWGFLQISTLAGNLTPSLYLWEVLFTMGIGALGLLMFASLIGSMQNFLQALGRRKQEMQMRRYDVENFMERRRLPLDIRKQVRLAERFKWVATHGVEDDEILDGFSEDLQIKIKCHVCGDLLKEVRLFKEMEKEVKSAIFERLHQKVYVKGCKILRKDCPAKRMYFILRGSLSCVGQNGFRQEIGADQFCGEELLIWHLEQKSDNRSGAKSSRSGSFWSIGQNAISSQEVECQENVDAFVLEAHDVEYITKHYGRLLRTPRVRGILRNDSTSCRLWAAVRIQSAWRYRARKLRRLKAQAAAEAAAHRQGVPRTPSQANRFR